MWSRHQRLFWLGLTINLAACGGAKLGSDAGAFTPAPWPPPDTCGLLTFADVQPLLPNVDSTYHPDPLTPEGPHWIDGCDWGSQAVPEGTLHLSLIGALTPDGETALDRDVTYVYLDAGSVQTVPGLGTSAAFIDVSGSSQTLNVRFKSYLIALSANGVTPDAAESALQPLAVKVMGQL